MSVVDLKKNKINGYENRVNKLHNTKSFHHGGVDLNSALNNT